MTPYQTRCRANHVAEWSFRSDVERADPFNEITLDLMVTGPDGHERAVPAFWAGGSAWGARYASPNAGHAPLAHPMLGRGRCRPARARG